MVLSATCWQQLDVLLVLSLVVVCTSYSAFTCLYAYSFVWRGDEIVRVSY